MTSQLLFPSTRFPGSRTLHIERPGARVVTADPTANSLHAKGCSFFLARRQESTAPGRTQPQLRNLHWEFNNPFMFPWTPETQRHFPEHPPSYLKPEIPVVRGGHTDRRKAHPKAQSYSQLFQENTSTPSHPVILQLRIRAEPFLVHATGRYHSYGV